MSTLRVRIVLPTATTPIPRFVLVSAAIHFVGLSAMLFLPGLIAPRPELLPTLDAVLVGPLAAPTSASTPARPPASESKPKPAEPEPVDGASATPVEPPKPKPLPPEKPKPESKKPPEPPAPRESNPPPTESEDSAGEMDDYGGAAGPIGAPGSGAALAGMGAEFDWYRQSVVNALFNAWRQPFAGGVREPVEVAVSFEILRDGSVRGIQITSPSGNSRLDRSAYRAVQDASLPPLPRNYGATAQPALFVFRLFPESGY